VEYSVFGCGNRDWAATYQAIPTLIDAQLAYSRSVLPSGPPTPKLAHRTRGEPSLPRGYLGVRHLTFRELGCDQAALGSIV